MAAPLLSARKLLPHEVTRDDAPERHAIDLTIERGTITCIVGPQGGGKTAYLRALAAVDAPASGDLNLLGTYCSNLGYEAWRRLRPKVAYVADGAPLLSVLGGLMNVMLPALYHRVANAPTLRARASELLEQLGWQGDLEALPAYLDGHQRRLLALARCLILDPKILFVDEPFRMTDVAGWQHMGDVFVDLARGRKLAVVVVTHHLPFVRAHADRIVFLHRGGWSAHDGWQALAASDDPSVAGFLAAAGQVR